MNRLFVTATIMIVAAGGSIVAAAQNTQAQSAVSKPAEADSSGELTREMFLEDKLAPRHQPANYDVTIVKYTDYQCPYCRKAHVALKELAAKDKKVRILYRDWPIFGPASEQAARLAIASKWQDRHAQFHDALMLSPGKLNDAAIRAAAKKAGVNWERLQSDLKSHSTEIEALLQRNDEQANALGLDGTPGFIIGETYVPGGVDLIGLKELVAEARQAKSKNKFTAPAQTPGI